MDTSEKILSELRRRFGHEAFRPGQEPIVETIHAGRDTLVVMPTGGGKSLCYQLPAVLADGVALVISPLIALMKDQVDALEARGIEATFINSSLSPNEQADRIRAMREGAYHLVYVAPERFRHRAFVEHLKQVKLSFVAIDEAHCISQWGHDFRPDYLRIGEMLEAVGRPPVCAFTATATPEVRTDIQRVLQLRDPAVFVTGFARPNLRFEVHQVSKRAEKFAGLSRLIATAQTGIVYCATRKRVEEVAELLEEWEVAHVAYHGGLPDEDREQLQNRFIRGEADVAVATNAFGMGIDRADLRFVAHFDLPGSIEAYYQEAGRAGRDGLPSNCVLFYNYADRRTQDFFIDGSNPSPDFVRSVYHQLLELADAQHEIQRSVQDLTELIGSKNSMQVGAALKLLGDASLVERFDLPGERIRGTRLLRPDVLPFQVALDEAAMIEKERRDRAKLDAMITYATSRTCRQGWMLEYFGEKEAPPCHRCDHCRRTQKDDFRPLNETCATILRKLLSGVARMSDRDEAKNWVPRYGRGLILQMLTGSAEQRISQFGLDRLSTYGLLKEFSAPQLRAVFDAALDAGFLYSTGGSRPLVSLTPMGSAVMQGKLKPEMTWPREASATVSPARSGKSPRGRAERLSLDGGTPDASLFDALRRKRIQLAKIRGNIPPYAILSNRALEGLSRLRPTTPEESLSIPGIGPAKASSVVPAFLEVIAQWDAADD